jgi:hypothetical protein
VLAGATLASKARHTALEHAARQELSELALDELRQTDPSPASAAAPRKASRCSATT